MKKYNKVVKPFEGDFYSIGKGTIHIWGYTYEGDAWELVEVTRVIIPLDEFVKNYKERGKDYINEIYDGCNQYQDDFHTDNEILKVINEFFDGKPADYFLDYAEITEETPDGNYVCLNI